MPIAPPATVAGPTRTPLPYGLFSVVPLRESGGDRWEAGVQFESGTCEPAAGIGAYDCEPTATTVGLPKDLAANAGDVGEATQFTIYGHYTCSIASRPASEMKTLATEHLTSREEAAVEAAFWTGSLGNTPALAQPTTTTIEATALSLAAGLGALEEFIATSYGSVGVIHVTRGLATALLAKALLTVTDGRLTTALGTPVVAGAGYPGTGPDGTEPLAGSWAYATPAMLGYRSEIFAAADGGIAYATAVNDATAIAERNYLIGYDPCGVGAVLIDPSI